MTASLSKAAGEPVPRFTPTPFKHRELATIPRRQFLYGKHYVREYLSATVAPSGLGKSALSIADAVAMASGCALLGAEPVKRLRVWYWNGEDPREEIERRVEATCLHFRVDPVSIEDWLSVDSGRDTEVIVGEQTRSGMKIAVPVVEALTEALRAGKFDVLILDPFVSVHRVAENDNVAIDAVAKMFGRVAGWAKCSVETVHHVRKTGGAEITAEDGRGASAHVAAARSVRVLNRMSEQEGKNSGVGEERRFYFRSHIDKANLAPPNTKATWYKLANVALGNGPPEDQDYVGVPTLWHWPDAFAAVTVADLRAVQARVAQGRWRENSQAKDWIGKAVAEVLKLDPTNEAARTKIRSLLKTWIEKGMFVVVEGVDDKREKRSFVEVGELAND
jgi:hypothetical protein